MMRHAEWQKLSANQVLFFFFFLISSMVESFTMLLRDNLQNLPLFRSPEAGNFLWLCLWLRFACWFRGRQRISLYHLCL